MSEQVSGIEGARPEVGQIAPASAIQAEHEKTADTYLPGSSIGTSYVPKDVNLVIARGEGARIQDESGNWYIDYIIGAGAMILGHAHPAVQAAAIGQVQQGTHFFSLLTGPAMELAAEIVRAAPCAEKVNYTTTGSEATFFAMRMARAFTGKSKILKFEGGYHGAHDYALVSMMPNAASNYPAGQPDTGGVPPELKDNVLVSPYNDLEAVSRIVQEHRGELAGIMVEPIQRIIPAEPGFLQGLRKIADDNGVLLLFDEVVTGFRLAYGGGQEYFDVTPDLASYGKIVGGGFAQGAIAGRADIMDTSDPGRKDSEQFAFMNGTFNGNPVAAASALATLAELRKPGVYDRLNGACADFREAMRGVLKRHDVPALVIGDASMWQLLFTDKPPKNHIQFMQADLERTKALDTALIKHGVLILPLVRRSISTAHTEQDFEDTCRALDAACRELY